MQEWIKVVDMMDRFEGIIFKWDGSKVMAMYQRYDSQQMMLSGDPYKTETIAEIDLEEFCWEWVDEVTGNASKIENEGSVFDSFSTFPDCAVDEVLCEVLGLEYVEE